MQSLQLGYEVGRYISLERLVEQNKERYYDTLEQSSHRWHEGEHNPWPYIHYMLSIMKEAYRDFVARVGELKSPRGEKRERILQGIDRLVSRPQGCFKIRELEQVCPGISRDMIRYVLRKQQAQGAIRCSGRGAGAAWSRNGSGGQAK
ncbi:hypothetical protein Thiowin_02213 [Thiorhodovibrio winogradskyi]|uniref:Filamentation induced by cAMP protein Fic n=1 Tax=Thiorhodovibrio winogradskyi TaxID=77007 RepID=A0ABZ0SAW3_9GAMM|nr:hypothetical protein [Thiorhodovibrio winogradskyi]